MAWLRNAIALRYGLNSKCDRLCDVSRSLPHHNDGTIIVWNLDLDDLLVRGYGLIRALSLENKEIAR
ncbi:hypothetical protein H6G33_35210 [Calothrix sp. FACHB-1219]|uniref:hypothetical protein n=1 Tax=unclassified Calothrix TaxID=2619626 RepID=UPI001687F46C|nr:MULTISPECIES: hypothetical protein [unclassified Calothrix]MBD2207583.1 hypothetical protein [Calothrix sp. FACHB-168]MBD2222184.1 hypothetical protein [Calothrix sp. FACHB-1219]